MSGDGLSDVIIDVRTHPPLIFTFPPPSAWPKTRSSQAHHLDDDDDAGLSDFETSPVRKTDYHDIPVRRTHNAEDSQATIRGQPLAAGGTGPDKIITTQGLLLGASPYVYLDDARFAAFSPSNKASFPSSQALHAPGEALHLSGMPTSASNDPDAPDPHAIQKALAALEGLPPPSIPSVDPRVQQLMAALMTFKSRLPNTMLQVDLRTLNLHLALRTSEVLACAEAMWEWVLEFQAQRRKALSRKLKETDGRPRAGSVDASTSTLHVSENRQQLDPVKSAIAELSRADFDGLLSQFNM